MTHSRRNKGVCSYSTTVTIENGIITEIKVEDGCEGNLQGICALLPGTGAAQAAQKLRGIKCGMRPTSCPAQIALCLEEALEKEAAETAQAAQTPA